MIITLISWGIILGLALLLGDAFLCLLGGYQKSSKWDICVVSGLLLLDVYAQFFSIFSGVGVTAFVVIAVISVLWGVHRRTYYRELVKSIKKPAIWQICVVFIVVTYVGLWTIKSPSFVDTYLYHAQAIRWIEEYGVVPGLGNLHNRFAYNSAFMPLQALFSFAWAGDVSLHSLNGFLGAFFVVHSITTNRLFVKKESRLSDYLKLVLVIYVYFGRTTISSPNSDLLAMLLVDYIIIKWCECFENDEEIQSYGILCIIAVWAMSVKLSAVIAVLLVVYPATVLIKEKKYTVVAKDIICGIVVVLPWLIRNVIISGYLLYPYSELDLFDFEWEIPKNVLWDDRKGIVVWAREVKNLSKYNQSITEWIGTWFEGQMFRNKIFIIGGFLAAAVLLVYMLYVLYGILKKTSLKYEVMERKQAIQIIIYMVAGLLFWLFSAPLLRYGLMYLLMPMAFAAYMVKEYLGEVRFRKTAVLVGVLCGCGIYLLKNEDFRLVLPQDYWRLENEKVIWNGIEVYVSAEGERLSDYYAFPSVPEAYILDDIELRGESIKEGFKAK